MDSPTKPVVPKGPYGIADGSRMSEDYILSDKVLVDSASPNPLAVARTTDGMWTALAVVPGIGLVHVAPDQNSQSGWDLLPLPSGQAVKEVVAAQDGANTSHAFYQDGVHTYHSSLGPGGTWSAPDQLPMAVNLAVTNVPLTNEPVAVGIDADGNLLLIRQNGAGGRWQGTVADAHKALVGAQAVLQMIDAENWTLAAVAGGKLQLFSGQGSTFAAGPNTVSTPHPVTSIHFTYQRSGSTMVMFSDDQHTLYTSVGFSDQPKVIAGASIVQGTAVIDTATPPKIHFYGAAPNGGLWVLHQTAWDATDAPVWAPLLPLDKDVATVASPQSALAAATLFAAGSDQTLHVLTQNHGNKIWRRTLVQQPGKTPYSLTRYRTQLMVRDVYGNPAPGVAVTIGASEETAILAGGKTYFVGPGAQTATLKANQAGVITVTRSATSLVCPSYTVTPSSGEAVTVNPAQNYHDFLTGTAAVNTGSAVIPPMSDTTLKTATVGGQPLAPVLADDKTGMAATVATGIQNAMKSVQANAGAVQAAGYAGWSLDLRDPGNPQFSYYHTQEELGAYKATLHQGLQSDGGVGGIIDGVGAFFGDLLNAVETAAAAVTHFVFEAASFLLDVMITVADEVIHLTDVVIQDIEQAIPFVHALFNFIGALADKVLDWVKDVFGWNEIWNTKKVFEHLVTEAFTALQWAIGKRAEDEVQHFFSEAKGWVDEQFAVAISHFDKDTLSQIATPAGLTQPLSSTRLTARGGPAGQPGSTTQNNWLMSKVMDNAGGSNALAPLSTKASPNLTDTLKSKFGASTMIHDLGNALTDLTDFLQTMISNPQDLGTRGVADLIKAAQAIVDFVLDLLDTLVVDILDVVSGALGIADSILTQQLGEIPVVSWLYTNVVCPSDQPEEPSILRLASLVAALPVTLMYKVANQMRPPFDGAATERILNWHFTKPGTEPASPAAVGAPADATPFTWAYAYLSIIQACADMAADGASLATGGDDDPGSGDPLVVFIGWGDLLIAATQQVLSWPGGWPFSFNWDWGSMSKSDKLGRATWLIGWAVILINLALLVLPEPADGEIAEMLDPMGKAWCTVLGAGMFGTGLASAVMGLNDNPPTANRYDVAAAVLGPLPLLTTYPLLVKDSVESSDGVTLAVKLLIDDLGDIGAGFIAPST